MDQKQEPERKPICFVIMPISDHDGYEAGHFRRVYDHIVRPAVIKAGYEPVRADDTAKTDYIVVGIIQNIITADMVLCDLSARNANVLYELGVRHAFSKPVTLIRDKITDRIFDIQGLRYTEYDHKLRVDTVMKDIEQVVQSINETAAAGADDVNSVVQLANLKPAKVPDMRTISNETKIIMSAIQNIEQRIDKIGYYNNGPLEVGSISNSQPAFEIRDGRVIFAGGEDVSVGNKIYHDGELIGTLNKIDLKNRSIFITDKDKITRKYLPHDARVAHFDGIPF